MKADHSLRKLHCNSEDISAPNNRFTVPVGLQTVGERCVRESAILIRDASSFTDVEPNSILRLSQKLRCYVYSGVIIISKCPTAISS